MNSTTTFTDTDIDCADCGQTFTWTAEQQEFYRIKALSAPKRCKACREKRKAEKEAGQQRRYRN